MKEINGITLKEMFISGANNLFNNYPAIDALNVFPVPDGDTGLNMNLTVSSGAKEINNLNDTNIFRMAKAFSKGLLMGARGNSGVITSQIFRGFANGLENKETVDAIGIAEAMMQGKDVAYKAVMRPVEGTMLTVIREAAEVISENAKKDMSIEKAFEIMLAEARESLKRTPDLLPVLKEVGVVDSGGAGVVAILEGMLAAITTGIIQKEGATSTEGPAQIFEMAGARIAGEEEFGYCTEFILRIGGGDEVKKSFNEKRFASVLNSQGNSIVMVRDEDILKVHIHTLRPGITLNYAQQFGEFVTLKIENMTEQHDKISENAHGGNFVEENATVTSSTLEAALLKEYGLISTSSGDGLEELFKEYRVDHVVKGGQTMNPSTEDFVEAIKKVHAKTIFILPNNGNIVLAANQAAELINDEGNIKIFVIPTKTIPEGLVAAMNFNPEVSPEDNFEIMSEAIQSVNTGQVTFAIKDTTVEGVKVKKDYFMALSDKKVLCSVKDKFDAVRTLLRTMITDETWIVTIIYGEDVSSEDAEKLLKEFEGYYTKVDIELINGGQPVYSFIVGVE